MTPRRRTHGLKRNMQIFQLPDSRKVLTPQPIPPHDVPKDKIANPQARAPFFSRLPQEVRDEIYSLVLTSNSNSFGFFENSICGCATCRDRREDDGFEDPRCRKFSGRVSQAKNGSWFPRADLPFPRMKYRRNPSGFRVVPFFLTCRRIYDEARPVLQQVNEVWIDCKSKIDKFLCTTATGLSTHRGMNVTSSVLVSATLVFNLAVTDYIAGIMTTFTLFHHLVVYAQKMSTALEIRHLQIIIGINISNYVANFIPLLRFLENLRGVQTCCVKFRLSDFLQEQDYWDTPDDTNEREVLGAVAAELERAALSPPPLADSSRDAINDFAAARQILLRPKPETEMFPQCLRLEQWFAKHWGHHLDDPNSPTSWGKDFGLGEFMAAQRAMQGSILDPRAFPFDPEDSVHFVRGPVLLRDV